MQYKFDFMACRLLWRKWGDIELTNEVKIYERNRIPQSHQSNDLVDKFTFYNVGDQLNDIFVTIDGEIVP